jgi:Arc/MetJ family transcription regulator
MNDMTRTNVVLDEVLVEECRQLTGIPTQRSLIDHALRELLRHGRQKKVLELKGRISWQGDLRAWRRGRGIQ